MLFLGMSALLLAGLAVLGFESLRISGPSGLYPQVLIGASIVLLVWNGLQSWRAGAIDAHDPELASLHTGVPRVRLRFALFCAIWLLYPLLMTWTGFIASTTIVLYGSALIFGSKRPWLALLGTLCFAIVFSILLKSIIYVPVPEAWPDKWVNALIYRF